MLACVLTWLVLTAFYLLCAGQVSTVEGVAGLLVGAVGAIFSVLIRRAADRPLRLRAPWLRVVLRPLAALLPDAARVGRVLLSAQPHGEAVIQPFAHGGETPEDAGRRALVTLGASLAPNGYVLRIPGANGALLMHRLAHVPPKRDRAWPL